ncbi:MAG: hypothetical protein HBSAPP03_28580 [Phycisphaerae bacterium]|nr:MAG: hypothetical protein HBSAPP03_28580 [Phycisphaerae bacterium]
MAIIVAFTHGGCGNSIYHQARAAQPADSAHRLRVRIEEGRKLAESTRREVTALAGGHVSNPSAAAELLVVHGHDLRRSALSIQDVAARVEPGPQRTASLDLIAALTRAGEATIRAGEATATERAECLQVAQAALGRALEAAGRTAGTD